MSTQIPGKQLLLAEFGTRVDRAAANLPATTSGNLFSVSGQVIVTSIYGIVTTAIQAQANAIKLEAYNTAATTATDMCATVESNGQGVGKLFGITGTTTAAAVFGFAVPHGRIIVGGPGFIRLNAAATNTGQMAWFLTYVPLTPGASVAAV